MAMSAWLCTPVKDCCNLAAIVFASSLATDSIACERDTSADWYRTPGWAARCEAVAKLEIELREGKVVELVQAKKSELEAGHGVSTECRSDSDVS